MLLSGINHFKFNGINVKNANLESINFSGTKTPRNLALTSDDFKTDILDFSYNPKGIKEYLVSDGLDEVMADIIAKDENTYKKYRDVAKSITSKNGKFIHQTSTEQGLQVLSIVNNNNMGRKTAKRVAALEALGINNAVFYGSHADKYWRIIDLICEDKDGNAVFVDDDDNETILKRPLSIKEFNEITSPAVGRNIFSDNQLIKDYIEIVDGGLNIKTAAKIASDENNAKRYMQLTSEDKFGQTIIPGVDKDIILSRKLTPNEAATVVLKKEQALSNYKVQSFIDLKDDGLHDFEALQIASSYRDSIKYFELTTPDGDGNIILLNADSPTYVEFDRPLTPKEAAFGLKLGNQNLKAYQKLLDKGLSIGEAYAIASDIKRAGRFFKLITANEDGEVRLINKNQQEIVLPRALSVNEALIAISELYTPQKIYHQLAENGVVTSKNHVK